MSAPVALLTDFGLSDPFVGVMKGVLLSRCPGLTIIDLAHGIGAQDVRRAALALMESYRFLPDGTLFVCVVDPGVGSGRRIVWARSERFQFLAPDNGLLSWTEAREPFVETRSVGNAELFLKPVSGTFHGRDIFAPVAAALANGLDPARVGPRLAAIQRLAFPEPRRERGRVRGELLAFDRFGNAITNLRSGDLPADARFRYRGADLGPLRTHYAEVPPGRPVAVIGSSGFAELSVRDGSFAREMEAGAGDPGEALAGAARKEKLHGR